MTELSESSCLSLQLGMVWPNCDCTQRPQSKILRPLRSVWVNFFEILRRWYALNTRHMTYQLRKPLAAGARVGKQQQNHNHHQHMYTLTLMLRMRSSHQRKRRRRRFYGGREGLIWTITSFIPLVVIQRRFGNMVPLITTTHKPYVNYSLSKAFFS